MPAEDAVAPHTAVAQVAAARAKAKAKAAAEASAQQSKAAAKAAAKAKAKAQPGEQQVHGACLRPHPITEPLLPAGHHCASSQDASSYEPPTEV